MSGSYSDSWLTGRSDLSAEDSGSDLVENSTPPLVVISSRIKNSSVLSSCANAGVVVVRYSHDNTSLSGLLASISRHLKGRLALSIALLMDGKPGSVKICSQKVLAESSLLEDKEVRDFFQQLVDQFLHRESQYVRLDFLICPVSGNKIGQRLLTRLRDLLKIPVYAASDILGPAISNLEESIRIGTLYFDKSKLQDQWNRQPQTKALFEKIRTVGKGAYGAAILYRKKDDDSLVILKEINLMELSKQERSLALNEVQILSMLDHPNIISYYDNFEEDGLLMIEMEYADGGTLAQFLRQRTSLLIEQDILAMFMKMVDALRYLHEHKILHRDLKTANIFLTKEGGVKMGDFGISKVLTGTSVEAHTTVGTPFYISPEICEGKTYNAKSDVWSLGCILYEMACLEKTFEGTNLPAIIHKIVQVSVPAIKGTYSEGFKVLVTDMLLKDPQARPSAHDLYTLRVPALMLQEEEEEVRDTPPDDTTTKSFLYHLDSESFLLRPIPTAPIKPLIDHVCVGYGHIVAVTYEHSVYSWGDNGRGQLGHGDTIHRGSPQLVESLKGHPILRAECGAEFTIFISDNNIIMSCGRGDCGALGHGPAALNDCLKPKLIEGMLSLDTVGVACGMSHTIAITSEVGALFTWGDGRTGCLGNGSDEICASPCEVKVRSAGRMCELICAVRCGPDSSMFLTDSGRVYACGNNQYNKLGLNQRQTFIGQMRRIWNKASDLVTHALEPTPIKELGKHRVIDMAIGPTHSCLVVETGKVFTFGRNNEGQLCAGNLQPSVVPVNVKALTGRPTMVTCTELATMVTTQETSFMVWGSRPLIRSPLHQLLSGPQLDHTVPESTIANRTSATSRISDSRSNSVETLLLQTENEGKLHKSPSLHFNSPHSTVPCDDGNGYMLTLTNTLKDKENREGKLKQAKEEGKGGGGGKRGPSVSGDSHVDRDGVILEPTPLDLVGQSGMLADLSAQGLQQPKLEGIGHCAGNVLILIEAKVSEDKTEEKGRIDSKVTIRVSPPKPQLLLSKRLRDRRHINRRRLPTPILPEFKPPKSSDFEPTLSTHLQPTRARTDSDPLDPFQTRTLILDRPTKTELEISTGGNLAKEPPDNRPMSEQDMESDSEDSQVPTWIMKELAQAVSGPVKEYLSHSDHTPQSRPASTMDIEEMDSLSTPTTPPHARLPQDNSHNSASPPKPRFFLPEINLSGVDLVAKGGQDGARKISVQDGRLLAPVGYRKVSSGPVGQLKQEPIRLPTPHQRLKNAFSVNSIGQQTPTIFTGKSDSSLHGNKNISGPSTSTSTSKVLNVKKASSNVDLVSKPAQFYHPAMSRQVSAPKVHSQLVHTSQHPATSSSTETQQLGSCSSPRQPDSVTSPVAGKQYGSSDSMELVKEKQDHTAPPPLTSRKLRGSNSSLPTRAKVERGSNSSLPTRAKVERGSNSSLPTRAKVESDTETAMEKTGTQKTSKKEEAMQEEIKRLKEDLEMQKQLLKQHEDAMKELKEHIQSFQTTPTTGSKASGKKTRSKVHGETESSSGSNRTKSSFCVLS